MERHLMRADVQGIGEITNEAQKLLVPFNGAVFVFYLTVYGRFVI
jgi:hypothetical protein